MGRQPTRCAARQGRGLWPYGFTYSVAVRKKSAAASWPTRHRSSASSPREVEVEGLEVSGGEVDRAHPARGSIRSSQAVIAACRIARGHAPIPTAALGGSARRAVRPPFPGCRRKPQVWPMTRPCCRRATSDSSRAGRRRRSGARCPSSRSTTGSKKNGKLMLILTASAIRRSSGRSALPCRPRTARCPGAGRASVPSLTSEAITRSR